MAIAIAPLDSSSLNLLARLLADTVTHAELTGLLAECSIPENGGTPKWQRIEFAWTQKQTRDGCANAIMGCMHVLLRPVRFVNRDEDFQRLRDAVNRVLAFAGIAFGEDGAPRRVEVARTLSDAARRVDSLRSRLEQRGVHPDVMRFCRSELLQENYFHAVLEAAKSVAEKLRVRSCANGDGAELIDATLAGSSPVLAINTLQTETEWSEQRGFVNLLKGIFGTFRNVTAHAPKVKWAVSESDALDMLSMISYVHRRLDAAAKTSR